MTHKWPSAVGIGAMLLLVSTHTWAKDDKAFLREAIQGNLAEVDMGRLAQKRSRNEEIKNFGDMLVQDHSEANTRANAVARQIGLNPPTRPSVKQRLSYGYYASLRGNTFDRQFVKHMVDDHKKDIQAYQAQAQSGTGPVADYAKQTLPTLEKHLNTAESLQSKPTAQRK